MGQTRRSLLAAGAAAVMPSLFTTTAQAEAPARLSLCAQYEDLAVVRQVLDESHVGLEWYLDRASFVAQFEELLRTAATPATTAAFQLRLTQFVALLGHGHTTLEAPAAGEGYWLRRVPKGGPAFPLGVRVIDGRLFVAHDLSADAGVGAGTEILTVDGFPSTDLLSAMEGLVSADGPGQPFKRYQIGPGWRFQDLLLLLGRGRDRHQLRLQRLDGRVVDVTVAAATSEDLVQRHMERRGRALDAFGPAVQYARRGKDGILTVRSFYEGLLPPGSAGFAAEFARAFEQIGADRPESLVLDLRSNEGGGNDYVPMLYAYLADRPFRFVGPTIVRSATISGLKYMDAPAEDLKTFAVDPGRFVTADPTYGWVMRPEFAPIIDYAPNANSYLGPLTVLTDGGSFSATGGLLELIHRYHRREGRQVDFLGEAPGVDTRLGWGSGGQSLVVTLPNSRFKLALPLLGSRNHFATALAPVSLPDRIFAPTPTELVDEVDGVLARSLG